TYLGSNGPVDAPVKTQRRADGKPYEPEAIGGSIRYAHRATGKPIMVTENGIDATDDAERARFIPSAIAAVEA
ncbi:hypothetical protein LJD42_29535, partial [Escherichia coli]|nr:hypothetical protein [Escherichia coli]